MPLRRLAMLSVCTLGILAACSRQSSAQPEIPRVENGVILADDANGSISTLTGLRTIPADQPFFRPLGGNGRACSTCHLASAGWSLSTADIQARFNSTGGTDPLFRLEDGANAPNVDTSTVPARQAGYSLLLNKGLIRYHLGPASDADFAVAAIDDPYRYATLAQLSVYRRPLPSTNVAFLPDVMWDGRSTDSGGNLDHSLASQARSAARDHLGVAALPDNVVEGIVTFERSLITAQSRDVAAGPLDSEGAAGGPGALAHPPADAPAMNFFAAWSAASFSPAQQAIARGQTIFNQRRFTLRDAPGAPVGPTTCATCHATAAGTHDGSLFVDTGVAREDAYSSDLPLYTLRSNDAARTVRVSDPGRALVTGRLDDAGKFKVPSLRGLAARPPYFHNGSAQDLPDVVRFYEQRSDLRLSKPEEADLVAFLAAL